MNKCDCCGQFGELEEVVITIKKHKDCDVNSLFSQPVNHVVPKMNLVSGDVITPGSVAKVPYEIPLHGPGHPDRGAPYLNDELKKIIQ